MKRRKPNSGSGFLYYIFRFLGFLLGARFFITVLLAFALYVSTYFLFSGGESLHSFVFDFKVHGIIFCSLLSIMAGGIINQFYDREKDRVAKPFRLRVQSFLKQKYFLYAYITLNIFSLGLATAISPHVFLFFVVYQFLMWLYSHKLSKLLIVNNLTFVLLTVYPFFGMLIYYHVFSWKIFFLALFLFFILLLIDIIKDILTIPADSIFNYKTLPIVLGIKKTIVVTGILSLAAVVVCAVLISGNYVYSALYGYYAAGILVFVAVEILLCLKIKNSAFYAVNILRLWVFVGIICMLLTGLFH